MNSHIEIRYLFVIIKLWSQYAMRIVYYSKYAVVSVLNRNIYWVIHKSVLFQIFIEIIDLFEMFKDFYYL